MFSLSSFIDLLNAVVCFLLAQRLWVSFRQSGNALVRDFALFYLIFGIFFAFLGFPFFVPDFPKLVQASFVFAHLFLYAGIAVSLSLIFKLGGINYASFSPYAFYSVLGVGILVFIFSLWDLGPARLHEIVVGGAGLISWSHGGAAWVRLLIGIGGTALSLFSGLFFFFYSSTYIKEVSLRAKGLWLGAGFILLAAAAFLAFVLSAFPFYGFWLVVPAELATIAGLLVIYRSLSLEKIGGRL